MTLTIKEKHLYRTDKGRVVYMDSISDGEGCAIVFEQDGSISFECFKINGSPVDPSRCFCGQIISEIPTPPIDFSRIGEMDDERNIALMKIGSDLACTNLKHGGIFKRNAIYFASPTETIDINDKKYRKADVEKLVSSANLEAV